MEDEPGAFGGVPRAALRRLRIALALFASGALIGGPWDMLWHTEHAFESFFSPPHLFIYGTAAASMATVASIVALPTLRGAFGPAMRVPGLRAGVPASLLFLGGGLLAILTSGVLDELWHAAFGVDETRFAAPHAMFGWGLFVATLGFASARLALKKEFRVGLAEGALFAFLLLAFSLYAVLLPFLVYSTDGTLRAIEGLPAIQAQPGALHTFRLYEAWDIQRGNLVFAPLACIWGGAALALVSRLTPSRRAALLATGGASVMYLVLWYGLAARLGTASDPRTWVPFPAFPALLAFLWAEKEQWEGQRPAFLAGGFFASLTLLLWSSTALAGDSLLTLALLIACTTAFAIAFQTGAWAGEATAAPTRRATVVLVIGLGILVPLASGALDLFMRANAA